MANCKIKNCDREVHSKGLCFRHYFQRWKQERKDETESRGRPQTQFGCITLGCLQPAHARGLCRQHYLESLYGKGRSKCRIRGCKNPSNAARGLCHKHYKRLQRKQKAEKMKKRDTSILRKENTLRDI